MFFLFISPVITKRAHGTLSLPKSVTRLEAGDRVVDYKREMTAKQDDGDWNGRMRRGRVRLFFLISRASAEFRDC